MADNPADRKAQTDLYMRKHYPELWRSVQEQSRKMKAERSSGQAGYAAGAGYATTATNAPRMVQQSKRAAGCNRTDDVFPPPECGDRYFDQYKNLNAQIAPELAFDLIGGGDPECTCIKQMPEFVVCSDQYLEYTFYDPFDWPKQILDYRNVTALWDEKGTAGSCVMSWKIDCPEPAATHADIMLQIDETLKQSPGTRTYLNQSLLDDYLDWRKANGTADGFQYIRVADKEAATPAPAAGQPGALNDGSFAAWTVVGLGMLGVIGAGIWVKIKNIKDKAAIMSIVASTSAPTHSAPTVRVASPSSMGSISTTVPHLHNPKPPAPTAGMSVGTADAASSNSNSSEDNSLDDLSAVVIDIGDTAPAGYEDD